MFASSCVITPELANRPISSRLSSRSDRSRLECYAWSILGATFGNKMLKERYPGAFGCFRKQIGPGCVDLQRVNTSPGFTVVYDDYYHPAQVDL